MKRAIFAYEAGDLKSRPEQLQAFVASNRFVLGWASVCPGIYIFKHDAFIGDIRKSFQDFLDDTSFIIADFSIETSDGLLPTGIWTRIKSDDPSLFAPE